MARSLIAAIGTAVLLAGCSAQASLPPEVQVSVFQNRFDYSERVLELKVSNGTGEAITVTRAEFDSTRFDSAAVWDRPQRVPAGSARDLKVQLAAATCDDAPPRDAVLLEFTLADGTSGSARVVPTDEQGRVDAIAAEDCLAAALAEVVTVTAADSLQWTPGAHSPAVLDLAVVPTGAAGSATISSAKGTVLLALADERGAPILALGVDVPTGGVIPLRLLPGRCDAHAVAEDKRGTFFPLEVTADGITGTVYIPVSDAVRGEIYEFYSDYCGLP